MSRSSDRGGPRESILALTVTALSCTTRSKSQASTKAVKDREALTRLLNDDKTKRDTLSSAQDQLESAQRKVDTLAGEEANLLRRKENVGPFGRTSVKSASR